MSRCPLRSQTCVSQEVATCQAKAIAAADFDIDTPLAKQPTHPSHTLYLGKGMGDSADSSQAATASWSHCNLVLRMHMITS